MTKQAGIMRQISMGEPQAPPQNGVEPPVVNVESQARSRPPSKLERGDGP